MSKRKTTNLSESERLLKKVASDESSILDDENSQENTFFQAPEVFEAEQQISQQQEQQSWAGINVDQVQYRQIQYPQIPFRQVNSQSIPSATRAFQFPVNNAIPDRSSQQSIKVDRFDMNIGSNNPSNGPRVILQAVADQSSFSEPKQLHIAPADQDDALDYWNQYKKTLHLCFTILAPAFLVAVVGFYLSGSMHQSQAIACAGIALSYLFVVTMGSYAVTAMPAIILSRCVGFDSCCCCMNWFESGEVAVLRKGGMQSVLVYGLMAALVVAYLYAVSVVFPQVLQQQQQ